MVSCSNGTPASPQFLSFLPRWRQPRPRNRIREEEEEHRPRARPQRLPRLTRRPHHTPGHPPHTFPHHGLRRRSRHRELCDTSLHRMSLHPALRRISLRPALHRMALRRSGLRVPPVRPRRPWPGMRHFRELLRLLRRKAAAGVARELPNRASSRPGRAALLPPHRAAAATPLHSKTRLRNRV
jgi:hypothetical protein